MGAVPGGEDEEGREKRSRTKRKGRLFPRVKRRGGVSCWGDSTLAQDRASWAGACSTRDPSLRVHRVSSRWRLPCCLLLLVSYMRRSASWSVAGCLRAWLYCLVVSLGPPGLLLGVAGEVDFGMLSDLAFSRSGAEEFRVGSARWFLLMWLCSDLGFWWLSSGRLC